MGVDGSAAFDRERVVFASVSLCLLLCLWLFLSPYLLSISVRIAFAKTPESTMKEDKFQAWKQALGTGLGLGTGQQWWC